MKRFQYRIVTTAAGQLVDEDRLNELGSLGYRLVSTIVVIDPYSDGSPEYAQFIFEKEVEDVSF